MFTSKVRIHLAASALLITALFSGCGGGGGASTQLIGSGGTGIISGSVTKGPMSGATITAYGLTAGGTMGAQIGTATSDGSGNYTMTISAYNGPVMLKVTGGTYTDEATGAPMTMGLSDAMTTVIPTISSGSTISGIQVTPLTSMAQTKAAQLSGGMKDTNITAANTSVGNYFNITDIVHVRPMNPLIAGSGTGASTDAKNYGISMAAISQFASTNSISNTSTLVSAMMSDSADGMMDGKAGVTSIQMAMGGMMGNGPMAANTATTGLSSAMATFMNSTANKSGLTATDMLTLSQKLAASNGSI
jgi:hypothetical protein